MILGCTGYIGEAVCGGGAEVLHELHERMINSGPFPISGAEATNVEGIEREFRIWIDVYIEGCAKLGISPVASSAILQGT